MKTTAKLFLLLSILWGFTACGTDPEAFQEKYDNLKKALESGSISSYSDAIQQFQKLSKEVKHAKEKAKDDSIKTELNNLLNTINTDLAALENEQQDFQLFENKRSPNALKKILAALEFAQKHPSPLNKNNFEKELVELAATVLADLKDLTSINTTVDFILARDKAGKLLAYLNQAELTSNATIDCNLDQAITNIGAATTEIKTDEIAQAKVQEQMEEAKQGLDQFCSTLSSVAETQRSSITEEIMLQIANSNTTIDQRVCDAVRQKRADCNLVKIKDYYTCRGVEMIGEPVVQFSNEEYRTVLSFSVETVRVTQYGDPQTNEVTLILSFPVSNCRLGRMIIGEPKVENFRCR